LRPIHRTSVDRPIPKSPAISRCVRPLVSTRRTASCANSFVNRRCCLIEFLIAQKELSTFPEQVQNCLENPASRSQSRPYLPLVSEWPNRRPSMRQGGAAWQQRHLTPMTAIVNPARPLIPWFNAIHSA